MVSGSGWNREDGTITTLSNSPVEISRLIIGYTTRAHLLLDLDETSLLRAVGLAGHIIWSWPEVGDVLVLESSTPSKREYWRGNKKGIAEHRWIYQNFHLVTDNVVGYDRCVEIIEILVDLDVLQPEYKKIRMFRGDMTLRVSSKVLHHRVIPAPKPRAFVHNYLSRRHDGKINDYLGLLMVVSQLSRPSAVLLSDKESEH